MIRTGLCHVYGEDAFTAKEEQGEEAGDPSPADSNEVENDAEVTSAVMKSFAWYYSVLFVTL